MQKPNHLLKSIPTLNPKTILGIETSCDDLSLALINTDKKIIDTFIQHQHTAHIPHGGIVPHIAGNEFRKHLPLSIHAFMQKNNTTQIDAVAFTKGPGMAAALSTGIMAAKMLCLFFDIPLVPVHHIEAHLLVCRFFADVPFPFLGLVASGGHTQIVLAESLGVYKILCNTRDDAAGEAFDKIARALNLAWIQTQGGGAGAALEKAAATGDENKYSFTLPYMKHTSNKFSFSGIKTAARAVVAKEKNNGTESLSDQTVSDIAASFQKTVWLHFKQLIRVSLKICKDENIKIGTFVFTGGVARNVYLRNKVQEFCTMEGIKMAVPPLTYCTDNGLMIAWAAIENFDIARLDCDIKCKWSIEDARSV